MNHPVVAAVGGIDEGNGSGDEEAIEAPTASADEAIEPIDTKQPNCA